jgi:hypothetical protein
MFSGKDTARDPGARDDRRDSGGGNAKRNLQAQRGIEYEWGGQLGELFCECLVLHELTLRERSRAASANISLNPPRMTHASHRHD